MVLFEALIRYQEGRLPRSMRLWVEQLLELEGDAEPGSLLPQAQVVRVD